MNNPLLEYDSATISIISEAMRTIAKPRAARQTFNAARTIQRVLKAGASERATFRVALKLLE